MRQPRSSRTWAVGLAAALLALTGWGGAAARGAGQPGGAPDPEPGTLDRREILRTIERVADWQLAHPEDRVARPGGRPQQVGDRSWIRGVFFTGVMAAHRATGQPRYLEAVLALGERNRWRPGRRPAHADDHCVSQVYLELFLLHREPRMIGPTRRRFDALVATRRGEAIWSWSDALFMSPPAAALLATATGDRRYLDWLASSWRQTEESLYDREQRLWYRDREQIPAAGDAASGPGRFWGRGNGWVLAGLARVLAHLPEEHPQRPRFETVMREMAARLVELQAEDGLWRSSLLAPAAGAPGEASASALIAFGLAAGINDGVLQREAYLPAVWRAWSGLEGLVDEEGRVGWVQPVGRGPGPVRADDSAEFGAGALLLAAEQVLLLASE